MWIDPSIEIVVQLLEKSADAGDTSVLIFCYMLATLVPARGALALIQEFVF